MSRELFGGLGEGEWLNWHFIWKSLMNLIFNVPTLITFGVFITCVTCISYCVFLGTERAGPGVF